MLGGALSRFIGCIAVAAALPACSGGVPAAAGGAGGAPGNAALYEIERFIGGIDRLNIVKRDRIRDYCVALTLAHPRRALAGFAVPANWGLEGVSSGDSADGCGRSFGVPDGVGVTGSVRFASVGTAGWPCSVDLDVGGSSSRVTTSPIATVSRSTACRRRATVECAVRRVPAFLLVSLQSLSDGPRTRG